MDNLLYFAIFKGFLIHLGFLSILSYFDPQIGLKSPNAPKCGVQCYIPSFYTYICQTGEIEMDNLPYLKKNSSIFVTFRVFGTSYINFDLF